MLSDSNNASIMPRNILQMRSATSQGVLRQRKRAGRGAKIKRCEPYKGANVNVYMIKMPAKRAHMREINRG